MHGSFHVWELQGNKWEGFGVVTDCEVTLGQSDRKNISVPLDTSEILGVKKKKKWFSFEKGTPQIYCHSVEGSQSALFSVFVNNLEKKLKKKKNGKTC